MPFAQSLNSNFCNYATYVLCDFTVLFKVFLINNEFKLKKTVAKFTEMKKEEENHAEIKISNLLFCSFLDRVPKFQAMECHYH